MTYSHADLFEPLPPPSHTYKKNARPFFENPKPTVLPTRQQVRSDIKNPSHRLGTPKAADITKARALATQTGKRSKMNISYGHELINWEMSVYFDNIGLVHQHIEKLISSFCGVKNARP